MTFVLPSAQRPKDEREKIPVVLLRAMLALAVGTAGRKLRGRSRS